MVLGSASSRPVSPALAKYFFSSKLEDTNFIFFLTSLAFFRERKNNDVRAGGKEKKLENTRKKIAENQKIIFCEACRPEACLPICPPEESPNPKVRELYHVRNSARK